MVGKMFAYSRCLYGIALLNDISKWRLFTGLFIGKVSMVSSSNRLFDLIIESN